MYVCVRGGLEERGYACCALALLEDHIKVICFIFLLPKATNSSIRMKLTNPPHMESFVFVFPRNSLLVKILRYVRMDFIANPASLDSASKAVLH